MVKRVVLGRSGGEKVVDLLKDIQRRASEANTSPSGNKVLEGDEDFTWTRPDGSEHSMREIDEDLEAAQGRIDEAEDSLEQTQVRLDAAEQTVQSVESDLQTLENVTLPNAVADLEAADQAAQDELDTLDGEIASARADVDDLALQTSSLESDLLAETAARAALAADVAGDLGVLDDKLATAFPDGVFDVNAELAQTIRNSVIQYAMNASETTAPTAGWSTTAPTRTPGSFIWFRTVITYADDSTSTSSAALLTGNTGADGAPGADGEQGPKGEDGTSVTILGTVETEAELPTSGNTTGDGYLVGGYLYVWTGIAWENVGLIQGPQGEPGADGEPGEKGDPGDPGADGDPGIGIASVTPYYRRLASSASAPAQPTTMTPSGWATNEPAWLVDTSLWRTERIVYSDATFAYTDVTKVAVFAGIDAAMAAANGKNKVTYTDLADASKPGPPPAVDNTRTAGDIHRNRRSSTGEIWAEYQWTGTQWKSVAFGDSVLTSVDAGKLTAGTASIQTGVIDKLWVDGLVGKTAAFSSISVAPGNLLPDPNGNTALGQNAYANLGFVWSSADKAWVRSSPGATNQTKPNAGGDYTSYPLEGGRVYSMSFDAKVEGTAAAGGRFAIYYTRRDGTTAFVGDQIEGPGGDEDAYDTIPPNVWTKVTRTWVAPDDVVMGGFALQVNNVNVAATSRILIRNPFVGPKANAVMIENGAIGADKINAASVGAAVGEFVEARVDKLTAGTATVEEAVANKLWAGIIASNQIVANEVTVGGVDSAAIADGAVGAVKIADGAVTTPKLTVTEDMSAAIVNAMSVNSKKLVVTDEAILNHATLIGDTVVDNINVSGKLIGQDGVFTGTVDFENVNVTGLQLVEKLEANSISADKIEGGHFTGETFEGGTFVGGEFRTSDNLPGQVVLADDAYVTHFDGGGTFPGVKVVPIDTTDMQLPAAIGPSVNGLTIFGGRNTGGGSSFVQAGPTASFMRTFRDDGTTAGEIQTSTAASFMRTYQADGATAGEIQTSPTASYMRTYQADGTTIGGSIRTSPDASRMRTYSGNSSESGWVQVRPQDVELAYVAPNNTYFSRIKADSNEAFLYTRAGGASRYLSVDANGVWVKTNKSGSQKSYNLEETAQDSGWQSFPVRAGLTGNDIAWRNKGGICHFKGHVYGTYSAGWNTIVSGLPEEMRPAQEMLRAGASSTTDPILRMSPNGVLEVRIPSAWTGNLHLSPLSYVIG